MDTFGLKIIASDKVFYEGRCRKLIIPAPDGEKGILANHENMVIAIVVGTAKVQLAGEDEWKDLAVGSGFAEIVNNRVTLLVDTAERPHSGVAGPGHEPAEGGAGQEVERTLGEYSIAYC